MKKNLLLHLLLVLLIASASIAQTYTFSKSTETYTSLSGATQLSHNNLIVEPDGDDSVLVMPLGFNFNFMGKNYDTLYFYGYAVSFELDVNSVFCPFYVPEIDEEHYNLLPIHYLTSGANGSRIFKMEVKNASTYGNSTDYTNYQLWLYETSGKIQLRIGTSQIADLESVFGEDSGPIVGLLEMNTTGENQGLYNGLLLSGNPSNPNAQAFTNVDLEDDAFVVPYLTSIPANGQVYSFSFAPTGINAVGMQDVSIYPNPVENYLTINLGDAKIEKSTIEVYDITGKKIQTIENTPGNALQVNFSNFEKGIYVVKIKGDNNFITRKITKI